MPEWVLQSLSMAAGACVAYGAIRYDIGRMMARIESHHERLERLEDKILY